MAHANRTQLMLFKLDFTFLRRFSQFKIVVHNEPMLHFSDLPLVSNIHTAKPVINDKDIDFSNIIAKLNFKTVQVSSKHIFLKPFL